MYQLIHDITEILLKVALNTIILLLRINSTYDWRASNPPKHQTEEILNQFAKTRKTN